MMNSWRVPEGFGERDDCREPLILADDPNGENGGANQLREQVPIMVNQAAPASLFSHQGELDLPRQS
ncbi:MAG: hypothetical protein KDA41_05435, partial [Planctomycetales bacterium]|nr:hypothetical protein [Planctomycetales bacterium]